MEPSGPAKPMANPPPAGGSHEKSAVDAAAARAVLAAMPKVLEGKLVMRQWGQTGLIETLKSFSSLDELYALCVMTPDPQIVDHIIIQGKDENGRPRELTFVFQSITFSPQE